MYKIMYCDDCTAVLVTDEDIDCLHCNKTVREIGFMDEPLKGLIEYENKIQEKEVNNEG